MSYPMILTPEQRAVAHRAAARLRDPEQVVLDPAHIAEDPQGSAEYESTRATRRCAIAWVVQEAHDAETGFDRVLDAADDACGEGGLLHVFKSRGASAAAAILGSL